jgi:hypothetical protein
VWRFTADVVGLSAMSGSTVCQWVVTVVAATVYTRLMVRARHARSDYVRSLLCGPSHMPRPLIGGAVDRAVDLDYRILGAF